MESFKEGTPGSCGKEKGDAVTTAEGNNGKIELQKARAEGLDTNSKDMAAGTATRKTWG